MNLGSFGIRLEYDYYSALVASTLVILFSEMLKFFKTTKLWRTLRNLLNYFLKKIIFLTKII
jgi:hypothetical protein